MKQTRTSYLGPLMGALLVLSDAGASFGQESFTSGSDGSDGALNIAGGLGTIVFDPATLNVDVDGDRVFHFSSITVGAGTTLRFPASTLGEGRPIVWLATGQVTILGNLDLNGQTGHSATAPALPADAGAGGFAGGVGNTSLAPARAGSGPGGGASAPGLTGGHGGHAYVPTALAGGAPSGAAYGNVFVLPALGGSGGGGGYATDGSTSPGGGGGGGAIVIASTVSIQVSGQILARGGAGGTTSGGGGGSKTAGTGSGGAIRLMAPILSGAGTLDVRGQNTNSGASGRMRLEAFTQSFSGSLFPNAGLASFSGPGIVFLPADAPKVRVTAVGGVAVTATPTGSFVTPDVVINSATPVSIDIAAENIPLGTQVQITLIPENGTSVTLTSTVLTGALANSSATVGPVTIPHGFTRFFVAATWAP